MFKTVYLYAENNGTSFRTIKNGGLNLWQDQKDV